MSGYIGQLPPQNAFTSPGIWTPTAQAARLQSNLWPVGADANYANVSLLVQPPATVTSYTTDATGKTITITGTVGLTGLSPFQGGAGFWFINNISNYLSFAADTTLAMGTGDFTVEAWVFPTSVAASQIVVGNNNGLGVSIGINSGTNKWQSGVGATTADTTATPALNVWSHVAIVRSSGTVTFYANGTSVYSAAIGTNLTDNRVWIGCSYNAAGSPLTGGVGPVRLTNGVARYTAAFTSPSTPFPTR